MAEGLAAIGLAGNIIQFISFSFVLLSKTKEVYVSGSWAADEYTDLDIITRNIRTFTGRVTRNVYSSTQLSEIAHRCDKIARELLDAITELQRKYRPGSGKDRTRWQGFRHALSCVWGSSHIEELTSRLEHLRDQVTMHLVSDTNDNHYHLMGALQDWKKNNIQAGYEITAQIQTLDIQLQDTQTRISDLQGDAFWKRLHDDFSRLSSKVHQVSQSHMIIASLRYESMHIRQSAIKDAHQKTFAWVYSGYAHHVSGSQVNTGFAQWLQCDNGIYWITGKPGSGKSTLMKYLYDNDETIQNLRIWSGNAPLVRACFYFWKPGQQMQKSLEGLLQTLLHHILHACPDLAPKICPERWTAQSEPQHRGIASPDPWTLSELQRSLILFRTQPDVTTKFYFQVDGLDEYYGDSWDVIETVRSLSDCPNVKLCLSSRPWNCFQDSFGKANSNILRVHLFTRRDIELFARDNLLSYSRNTELEPTLFDDLVREIGERAEGVFLWVRLVVRSLRNGIINEDTVSILQERLRTIPSDLEEFFEQILGSVEDVYRSRMAWTFLIAMRSPHQLKLIHYYFLEQEDVSFGFGTHSKLWTNLETHRCAVRTERRLNGRFKGLLEAGSTINIDAQTKVDFLHRTFSDFLATKRMREDLESWAAQELNVYTAISRTLIAESKFIDRHSCPDTIKLAIELSSRGAVETGNTNDCYQVIDQAELESERTRSRHSRCGLSCYILRFAASVGHADYLKHRVHGSGAALDLNCILKHAIVCPVDSDENYEFRLPSAVSPYSKNNHWDRLTPSSSEAVGNVPLPSLVKVLFELGADPNAIVDGTSSWTALVSEMIKLMDDKQKEQCFAVLQTFLANGADVNTAADQWKVLIDRMKAGSEDSIRNAERFFRCLFSHGLDPNATVHDTTLAKDFLRMLVRTSPHLKGISRDIQHRLLGEFLRCGADVSMVYLDVSSHGWFQNVCQELKHQNSLVLLSARVEQYRIFLEHGLDPNTNPRRNISIWKSFLYAIEDGIKQKLYNMVHIQAIRDMILASLQYGADPHGRTIQRILTWMRGDQSLLPGDSVEDIERALRKEIYYRDRQALSQPHLESQSNTRRIRMQTGAVSITNLMPPHSLQRTQQGEKRNHERMYSGGRGVQSKRSRFN